MRVLPTMHTLRAEVVRAASGTATAETIEECVELATTAVESLRELTRGIYPTNLTRSGLGTALTSQAARGGRSHALRIDPEVMDARFAEHVEAAAYHCCVEVLEHLGGEVALTLGARGELVVAITGTDVDALNGLAIVDRIEASGGVLDLPDAGSGDPLRVRLPAAAGPLVPSTPAAGVPG